VTEPSRELVPQTVGRSSRPSPIDLLAGAAGLGGRAGAGFVRAVSASIYPMARPAVTLTRIGWRSPITSRARDVVYEALDALESSGREDRRRAGATVDRFVETILDRVAVRLVRAGLVERLTAELIAADVPERVAAQVVESHVAEEVVEQLIASNTLDRLVETVLESPLYEGVVDRVLESEELWGIVYRIAHSPEVMSAITTGSAGLAGEVADQMRRRTEVADDIAETIARRVLRRAPRDRRW
jgi:hypothetical protein